MNIPDDFKNPVVVIALMILVGVLILIGAAIIGVDHGVLQSMSDASYARGLITYLFAVVTVGTAVVLVVSVLTSESDKTALIRFKRGKEVLVLLLGIFGTIVGFYFGSEIGVENRSQAAMLNVVSPLLGSESVVSGDPVTVTSAIHGGEFPYKYAIGVGGEPPGQLLGVVGNNKWIQDELVAPEVEAETLMPVTLYVEDAAGESITSSVFLRISPRPE